MNNRYRALKSVVKANIKEKIAGGKNGHQVILRGDIKVVPYSEIVLINPGTAFERPIKFKNLPDVAKELRELKRIEIRETELSA